ncbi:MAG TPA: hypothetical protein VJT82_00830 [Pyrinomonadaceae bacterium]|nr:hypothetical protein [Pyrinomonadaceae bacterium]
MNWDWQTVAVSLIILAALAYVGRRGWSRLRSFAAGGRAKAACATGCGSCGDEKPASATPRTTLVQIAGVGNGTRRKGHSRS